MGDTIYIIGQGIGIVAIALGFLTYQMKTREKLVFMQVAVAMCFCLHYLMIGASSGLALNILSVFRNGTYYFLGKKGPVDKKWAIFFSIVAGVIGVFSWQAWYSIFVVLGIVIHSYCISFSKAEHIRRSILVTSPLVLIYDIFVLSIGGMVYESTAIVSSIIGELRFKKEKQ